VAMQAGEVAQAEGGKAHARWYVLGALGSAALLLAAAAAIVLGTLALDRSPLPYQALYDYQAAKLEGPPADTIFVGDSTLGHAIDAELWSTLSGRRAVNLALTGAYGYEAGYNFIQRSLGKVRPRNVVLMYAPDMMTRPLAEAAYEATRDPRDSTLWQRIDGRMRRVLNFTELSESTRWLWRELTGGGDSPRYRIERDYMPQANLRLTTPDILAIQEINPAKIKYHRLIGGLCERERLNCVYLHGPMASPKCERSKAYFDRVAGLMSPSGIRQIAVMPVCLPADSLGDTEDHVRPDLKATATRTYYELIKSYLVE
jgi:hypothetical protein